MPVSIPHKGRLVVTGEGIIHQDDFERMKGEISGADGKGVCNARNLAAGSIRLLDPAVCRNRHIHFYAFNVIEGMEGFGKSADRRGKLLRLCSHLDLRYARSYRLQKRFPWKNWKREYGI